MKYLWYLFKKVKGADLHNLSDLITSYSISTIIRILNLMPPKKKTDIKAAKAEKLKAEAQNSIAKSADKSKSSANKKSASKQKVSPPPKGKAAKSKP